MENTRSVYILLSRHYDITSNMIYYTTGRGYTHVSIGLVQEPGCFYSFNFKGFRREKPGRWKAKNADVKMLLFEINVSEEAYESIREQIGKIKDNENEYSYNLFGLILCLMRIPCRRKNHYFCSQFVAELLKESGALDLKKRPSVCLPNTFLKELTKTPGLKQMQYNPVFA